MYTHIHGETTIHVLLASEARFFSACCDLFERVHEPDFGLTGKEGSLEEMLAAYGL